MIHKIKTSELLHEVKMLFKFIQNKNNKKSLIKEMYVMNLR